MEDKNFNRKLLAKLIYVHGDPSKTASNLKNYLSILQELDDNYPEIIQHRLLKIIENDNNHSGK